MIQTAALCRLGASMLMVLLVSACTIDVDEPVETEGIAPVLANEVEQPVATVSEPSDSTTPSDQATNEQSTPTVQVDPNTQQPNPGLNPDPNPVANPVPTLDPTVNPTPEPTPNPIPEPIPEPTPEPIPEPTPNPITGPQLDQSGIATSEAALRELLVTGHIIENDGRVTPTSVWICTDVFADTRNYFFYDMGVLNPVRAVVIERTLSQTDNTFVDIQFFWSVTSADSVLLSSLIPGEDGNLVTSGQQWDVTTIRFSEVESRPVFTAQSVLRGSLSCAVFAF